MAWMFKNKAPDGRRNLSGKKISALRAALPGNVSQRKLAELLQLEGIDLDKNAIQQIESGRRFVTDLELKAFAHIFHVTADSLLEND
jgi:transcriptional regulator with XRE-family HTH domain